MALPHGIVRAESREPLLAHYVAGECVRCAHDARRDDPTRLPRHRQYRDGARHRSGGGGRPRRRCSRPHHPATASVAAPFASRTRHLVAARSPSRRESGGSAPSDHGVVGGGRWEGYRATRVGPRVVGHAPAAALDAPCEQTDREDLYQRRRFSDARTILVGFRVVVRLPLDCAVARIWAYACAVAAGFDHAAPARYGPSTGSFTAQAQKLAGDDLDHRHIPDLLGYVDGDAGHVVRVRLGSGAAGRRNGSPPGLRHGQSPAPVSDQRCSGPR